MTNVTITLGSATSRRDRAAFGVLLYAIPIVAVVGAFFMARVTAEDSLLARFCLTELATILAVGLIGPFVRVLVREPPFRLRHYVPIAVAPIAVAVVFALFGKA